MTTEKKSDTLLLVEMRHGPLEEYIPKWWSGQAEPSMQKLARHLGVSNQTVREWFERYGFSDERVLRRKDSKP